MARLWLLVLACRCAEPAAGTLREDLDGLEARMHLPDGVEATRWVTLPSHRGGTRADARVYAWLAVDDTARDQLRTRLGAPLPPRAAWVPEAVAEVILPETARALLEHDGRRGVWRVAGERYRPADIGRGEYRGQAVVLVGDGVLYVQLAAR